MFENVIGASTGWRKLDYTWKDVSLYALAIGAAGDELEYIYEKTNMKVIPTFGVLPQFNAIDMKPERDGYYNGFNVAQNLIQSQLHQDVHLGLHMWHEIIMERPFDAIKGTMITNDSVTGLYDWGEKGIIITTQFPIYDEARRLICTNNSMASLPITGDFGLPKAPKTSVDMPDKEPDVIVDSRIHENQNALYRLTGDTVDVHVDKEAAKIFNVDRVFLHGQCTFGFACRMLIEGIIPHEPERVKRLCAQMRGIVFMGTDVQIHAWQINEGVAYFRMIERETGRKLLDNGVFEWK